MTRRKVMALAAAMTAGNTVGKRTFAEDKTSTSNDTRVNFYRNATMKIQYAGKTILMDPMLGEKGAYPGYLNPDEMLNPTSELTVPKAEIVAGVDFMLLSHTHISEAYDPNDPNQSSDHMDPAAIALIDKNLPIYLQPYDFAGMKKLGFTNLHPVQSEVQVGDISITRFDGVHVDDETWLPMIGESSGYLLTARNTPTILWSGDTLLTDNIKDRVKNTQPDIIILHPGGAWLPKDDKGNKATLLMGVDDVIEVAKLAPKARMMAIHVEALDHCPVTREDLRAAAEANGISKDRLIIPENGEIINF